MGTVTRVVKIVQGEDKTVNLRLRDENGDPFDITGATPLKAIFKKTDGTLLEKGLGTGVVIVNGPAGKLTVDLEDADTALLKVGEFQDFEVEINIGTAKTIVQFQKALTVRRRLA